jgi:hypothetical protein
MSNLENSFLKKGTVCCYRLAAVHQPPEEEFCQFCSLNKWKEWMNLDMPKLLGITLKVINILVMKFIEPF